MIDEDGEDDDDDENAVIEHLQKRRQDNKTKKKKHKFIHTRVEGIEIYLFLLFHLIGVMQQEEEGYERNPDIDSGVDYTYLLLNMDYTRSMRRPSHS